MHIASTAIRGLTASRTSFLLLAGAGSAIFLASTADSPLALVNIFTAFMSG
jgi:hypothetical protein